MNQDEKIEAAESKPPHLPSISSESTEEPKAWGIWTVLGKMLLVFGAMIAAELLVSVVYHVATRNWTAKNPAWLSLVSPWASVPAVIGLCWYYARQCQRHDPRAFLGLNPVPVTTVLIWCGLMLLLNAAEDGLNLDLGHPLVPQVMIDTYQGTSSQPLLLLEVIMLAPLMEEVMMRGFFLEGLRRARLGVIGAITASALLWSVMHLQYDLYGIAMIFPAGLLLGFSRSRTGSIYPAIAMHALSNLVATIELLVVLHRAAH